MKKHIFIFGIISLLVGISAPAVKAEDLAVRLRGRILLQVESKGEAWYINPADGLRYYLGRPADAFNLMRQLGLGISNADYEKFKDSAPARLAGKILLKVQDKGEAYYVNPVDMKLYFLGRPADAFSIMRQLGLGISNVNLNTIQSSATNSSNTNSNNSNDPDNGTTGSTNNVSNNPKISSIVVTNGGDTGFVDVGDIITITFDRAIDPLTINNNLKAGDKVKNVLYYTTGGVEISASGLVTIQKIATFNMGTVETNANFNVSLALSQDAKVLTITLENLNLSDSTDIAIGNESLNSGKQIGGTIKDTSGNVMTSGTAGSLSGTFGGAFNDDSGAPFISAIKITNNGDSGYIDTDDTIRITFNEAINPKSVDSDLSAGGTVSNVAYAATGGVSVSSAGKVTIKNIATFYMGGVEDSENFTTKVALSSNGKDLTITLTSGDSIAIVSENFSSTNQTGGTIEDLENKDMLTIAGISNPTGTFGGDNGDSDGPHITSVIVEDGGDEGYIDVNDLIVINFNEAIRPESINSELAVGDYVTDVPYSETGGVSVSADGVVRVTNIMSFDMGKVRDSGNFTTKVSLNSTGRSLTIKLVSGSDIIIEDENFENVFQYSGTVKNEDGSLMAGDMDLNTPAGTFGGNKDLDGPYITSIVVTNDGNSGYIDSGDIITITFSEAIDPASISSALEANSYISNVSYALTGGVSVSSAGVVTVRNIATFDMGAVKNSGNFTTKVALSSGAKTLTITLLNGDSIEIYSENLDDATQVGGTIEDESANEMEADNSIDDPTGTFGG